MNYIDSMTGMPKTKRRKLIRDTIAYLRERIKYRKQLATVGRRPGFTDDPFWLVDMAINRRAGWPDDPSFSRGSAMPVNGKYPRKASGDSYSGLRLIASEINTPRLIVRPARCGEWRKLIEARIPNRLFTEED